jgi:glycosyltransferase involved in cell wall biosynthesis
VRITLVLPHAGLSGGIRVLAEHAKRLAARGHHVVAVSQPLVGPGVRDYARALLKGQEWPRREAPGSHFDGLSVEHTVLERNRPVTDADLPDADVVVATWWETAEWVGRLSRRKGAKAYFIQGDETSWAPDDGLRERVRVTWRQPFRRMVVASWLAEVLAAAGAEGPVTVVANAVDSELFNSPPRSKRPTPTVGMVYSPMPLKGCDVAAGAVRIARESIPDLHMVSFGTSQPTPEAPLPDKTDYTCRPDQDQIPRLYASCDAWLFPSRREGFGLPILEAMGCRTPVIAARAGAAPQLLKGGGGVLVGPDHPRAMAAAIVRIAQMPEPEWRAMSEAARTTSSAYTWDDASTIFERVLIETAAGQGHAAAAGKAAG